MILAGLIAGTHRARCAARSASIGRITGDAGIVLATTVRARVCVALVGEHPSIGVADCVRLRTAATRHKTNKNEREHPGHARNDNREPTAVPSRLSGKGVKRATNAIAGRAAVAAYQIESLSNRGISFISEEYLPRKLRQKDWLA